MTSGVTKLLAAGRRELTLTDSGLEVRILRARVYDFLRYRIPLGSLLQAMSGALWSFQKGEEIPDKLAAQVNEGAPTFAELSERLLIECVFELREPGREWERLHVVPNEEGTDPEQFRITVEDFTRGLTPTDLGELQRAIWDHNGLGKGVAQALEPFRDRARPPAPQDGESLRETPGGAPGAGAVPVPTERGGADEGREPGGGGAPEGGGEEDRGPGEDAHEST